MKVPAAKIKGILEFMLCDDSQCLPPEELDFSFDVKGAKVAAADAKVLTPVAATAADTAQTAVTPTPTVANDSAVSVVKTQALAVTPTSSEKQSLWTIFFLGLLGHFDCLSL